MSGSETLRVILEASEGQEQTLTCRRLAIVWQGREIWIQPGDNQQLLVGVDDKEGDTEYANLLVRPFAVNLVGLQLELEPVGEEQPHEHEHGDGCCGGHDH